MPSSDLDMLEYKPVPWWGWVIMAPLIPVVAVILAPLLFLSVVYRWLSPEPAETLYPDWREDGTGDERA